MGTKACRRDITAHRLPQFPGSQGESELGTRAAPADLDEAEIAHRGSSWPLVAVKMNDGRARADREHRVHCAEDAATDHDHLGSAHVHQLSSARHTSKIPRARSRSSRETVSGGERVSTLPIVVLKDKPIANAA